MRNEHEIITLLEVAKALVPDDNDTALDSVVNNIEEATEKIEDLLYLIGDCHEIIEEGLKVIEAKYGASSREANKGRELIVEIKEYIP